MTHTPDRGIRPITAVLRLLMLMTRLVPSAVISKTRPVKTRFLSGDAKHDEQKPAGR